MHENEKAARDNERECCGPERNMAFRDKKWSIMQEVAAGRHIQR